MPDPTTDVAVEVAKEVAKQLPVREALAAPARQTGELLQDVVKTIQLALAPVQLLGALQDRLRAFIDRSVRAVPEDLRVTPPPQVLGPIIEAIRYEPEGTRLDHMFSELLSTSMDQSRRLDAHPAFVATVKSLSEDEAKILSALTLGPISQELSQVFHSERRWMDDAVVQASSLSSVDLAFPENGSVYLEHLRQLGLSETINARAPESILGDDGKQVGLRSFHQIRLSLWGQQFVRAALRHTGSATP